MSRASAVRRYPIARSMLMASVARSGAGAPCFERDNPRELACVPMVSPPIHYHALIGEKGPGHLRHREIVLFHGEYLYPEYLLGVQRVSPKGKAL